MIQTRIDQFYKVTCSSRQSKNLKNNVEDLSTLRSFVINKIKKEILSQESGTVHKNKKTRASRTKRKHILQKMNVKETHIEKMNIPTNIGIETKTAISPVVNLTVHTKSPMKSPGLSSKFNPKTSSPIKQSLDIKSPRSLNMVRRKLFSDKMEELMFIAIDNFNLAKEGAIADTNIDIEKIYSSKKYNYEYNKIDTTTSMRYEFNDIIIPNETYSRHFFLIVASVFSKPFNCGYFDKDELDLIFSLLTISRKAQELLIRMLKRKHTWHRVDNIKYENIAANLKPVFDELVSQDIFKSNTKEEDVAVLLKLLQVDEIRKLCHEYKIKASGKKEKYIESLIKLHAKTKPLFPGMPSPAIKLRASINRALGYCILINTRVSEVVNRIISLFIPNQDPQQTMADLFQILLKVEMKEIKFPEVTVCDFPIFANKKHLLNYTEAKGALCNVLNAIEKKQWELVRQIGSQAAERLPLLLQVEKQSLEDCTLPNHIRHFMPGYIWLKVLDKSVDAFKKTKETLPQAIESLHILIKQKCHMKHKKGRWYMELIKIEVYHMKNPNTSVRLLSKAVRQNSLTEVDRLDLLEKAENLAKRKSNISQHAKDTVKQIIEEKFSEARLKSQPSSVTIEGELCGNVLQRKSNWCISNGTDKIYGTVEDLALYYYKNRGYIKGVHCEGALPITLFGILFWDEIYNVDIPGAYVSSYEPTPLDLFSSEFYENRKEQIDMKLQIIRKFDVDTFSTHLKHQFDLHCEYTSICQSSIFDNSSNIQEVALCLGVEGVVGICERLIQNYTLWRAGFPDLIVWNPHNKQYKIVEVKGPGDSLSTKQKLWLQYLNRLGLNTEVCYCESNSKGRKRKHET